MAVLRFGQWTLQQRPGVWRWLVSKVYGVLRLVSEIVTNVTIDPRMKVGEDLHLVHAEGPISIHPDTVIGDRCGIMHNVTIGTNMRPGAPTLGDDVFIGVGACVLGQIRIGSRVHVSANSLVITDIPDDCIAIGVPAKAVPRLAPLAAAEPEPRSEEASG
jgi:serine O-acetyltransferase